MRDLDFRIKNKIISNKTNFKAFARAFIKKAFEERAEMFGKELDDSYYEYIEIVANHFIHVFWPFEDYPYQNLIIFLDIFNYDGSWDVRGSDSRIEPGVEELLRAIEPEEVFKFLHGKNYETMLKLNKILMEVDTAS